MSLSSCSLGDCRLWTADFQSVRKVICDMGGVSGLTSLAVLLKLMWILFLPFLTAASEGPSV